MTKLMSFNGYIAVRVQAEKLTELDTPLQIVEQSQQDALLTE